MMFDGKSPLGNSSAGMQDLGKSLGGGADVSKPIAPSTGFGLAEKSDSGAAGLPTTPGLGSTRTQSGLNSSAAGLAPPTAPAWSSSAQTSLPTPTPPPNPTSAAVPAQQAGLAQPVPQSAAAPITPLHAVFHPNSPLYPFMNTMMTRLAGPNWMTILGPFLGQQLSNPAQSPLMGMGTWRQRGRPMMNPMPTNPVSSGANANPRTGLFRAFGLM